MRSLLGFSFPSTTFPSRSHKTISVAVIWSYSTPLGLMAMNPCSRSIPETFPQVNVISPYFGNNKFASSTRCFNSSSILSLLILYDIDRSFIRCMICRYDQIAVFFIHQTQIRRACPLIDLCCHKFSVYILHTKQLCILTAYAC